MTSSVLLSGANGFIGRHLHSALERHRFPVQSVPDILKPPTLKRKPDVVVHLGGVTDPVQFHANLRESHRVNALGTLNMLEIARKSKAHFIFASSSGVYGVPRFARVSESESLAPINPYAQSKMVGELFCEDFYRVHGLPVTILRLFNVYGPGQNPAFLITYLIEQARLSKTVTLRHPSFKRDYLFVDDLVRLLVRLCSKPGRRYRVFNVGSGKSISVTNILKEIETAFGFEIDWKSRKSAGRNEVKNIYADISALTKETNWRPEFSLAEGLAAMSQVGDRN